ncbi:MAG: S-adenosylmethionine:tRNA ribosyltransferase-isomerase [Bacillales bacterium]|nr:S-adenosylmethionine:tRNA ribosyltransferase-isomerase [Bacillales bacterium]
MVLNKTNQTIEHRKFSDILEYLESGDTLVLNNTKVLPARLFGVKDDTNAKIEFLLLKQIENDIWEILVKPAKRVKLGTKVIFGDGILTATCVALGEEGSRQVRFDYEGIFYEVLDRLGEMPLPPYIREKLDEKDRYQTVYAKVEGSAAAPTAGLHFTKELLTEITAKGVNIAYITLHVGLGTFRPVSVNSLEEHEMHSEFYEIDQETADLLNDTKNKGKRIITVGTTSTRTLETVAQKYDGLFKADNGWTNIFIYPGYEFKAINCLITNFHLPKSTLIMLISALSSKEFIMKAYDEAIQEKYRFFSFGDAMFITE